MRSKQIALAFLCALAVAGQGGDVAAAGEDYVPKQLLTNEIREIQSFGRTLQTFVRNVDALEKKAQRSKSEIDSIASEAEAVKRAIPQFQRAAWGAIQKLQAAGKWTPELDTYLEQQLKEQGAPVSALQDVRSRGGARAVFQNAASLATDLHRQVDEDVKTLRGKSVARRLLEELVGTPVCAGLTQAGYCLLCKAETFFCSLGASGDCWNAAANCFICRIS